MNFDGRQEELKTVELQLMPEVSLVVNDAVAFLRGISELHYVKVVEMGKKTFRRCSEANNIGDNNNLGSSGETTL